MPKVLLCRKNIFHVLFFMICFASTSTKKKLKPGNDILGYHWQLTSKLARCIFSSSHCCVCINKFLELNCSLQVKRFSYFAPAKSLEKTRVCQDVWKSTPIVVNCKLLSSENCRKFLPLIDPAKPQTVLPF